MTWTTLHSRGETLRSVIDVADERLDGVLPMDVPGVAEKFDDELDLLGALQLRWHTGLAGRIDTQMMDQPTDPESAVVLAWRDAAADMPGIRAVIDHYRSAPLDPTMAATLARAVAKEHIMLAVMAGQGDFSDDVCTGIGAGIEDRARSGEEIHASGPAQHPRGLSLLIDRLKAVLAA